MGPATSSIRPTAQKGASLPRTSETVCATERVIDDEAPCSVWLPAQHIRGLAGHLYSFTVGSCTRKVPIGERKGQIVCFKDLPDLESEHWLSSKEGYQQAGYLYYSPRCREGFFPEMINEGNSKRADIVPPALLKTSVTVL